MFTFGFISFFRYVGRFFSREHYMVRRLETAVRILQVQYLFKKQKCTAGYHNYVKKNAFKKLRLYKAKMVGLHNPTNVLVSSQDKLKRQLGMVRALVMRQQDIILELLQKKNIGNKNMMLEKLKRLQHILKSVL